VIFGEAGIAGIDPAQENARRLARRAAYAVLGVASLGLALAWTASYVSNRGLITEAEARAAAAKREIESLQPLRQGDEARLLALLGTLRNLPPGRGTDDSWLLRLGLYQGEKLGAQAERAYRNMLRETLIPHLAVSLEEALRAGAGRGTLDAYLALHGGAGGDFRAVEQGALELWRLPEKSHAGLLAHLRAALAERPLVLPRQRNDELIERARRRLGGAKT